METPTLNNQWVKVSRGIYRSPFGRYQVRFRRGKRTYCENFDTIKEAEAAKNAKYEEFKKVKFAFLQEEQNRYSQDFVPIYVERHSKVKNIDTYNRNAKYTIAKWLELFKDRRLSEITTYAIEEFRARRLTEGVETSTINRAVAVIAHMMNKAVEWGFIREHNLEKIKKLEEKGGRLRFLTREEYDRLVAIAEG